MGETSPPELLIVISWLHIFVESELIFCILCDWCLYQYGFLFSWEQGDEIVGVTCTVNGIPFLIDEQKLAEEGNPLTFVPDIYFPLVHTVFIGQGLYLY